MMREENAEEAEGEAEEGETLYSGPPLSGPTQTANAACGWSGVWELTRETTKSHRQNVQRVHQIKKSSFKSTLTGYSPTPASPNFENTVHRKYKSLASRGGCPT
jgi:hypothetical protein